VPDGGYQGRGYQGRGTPVPAEALGQARLFRERVLAEDLIAHDAMSAVLVPLRACITKKQRLRPVMITQAVRDWDEWVPTGFLLARELPATKEKHWWRGRPRNTLKISQLRVSASYVTHAAWPDDTKEPGLTLARLTLTAGDGRLTADQRPLATVSMHALARRFERGGGDEAAILRDLASIVDFGVTAGDDVRCATGLWVGRVLAANDVEATRVVRLRHIRSYLHDDMIPAGRVWRDLAERATDRATGQVTAP
jgi:hypothetical protein